MKAVRWHAAGDTRVDTVSDPKIEDPQDLIIKVTSTAICGSDLHLYDGYVAARPASRDAQDRRITGPTPHRSDDGIYEWNRLLGA